MRRGQSQPGNRGGAASALELHVAGVVSKLRLGLEVMPSLGGLFAFGRAAPNQPYPGPKLPRVHYSMPCLRPRGRREQSGQSRRVRRARYTRLPLPRQPAHCAGLYWMSDIGWVRDRRKSLGESVARPDSDRHAMHRGKGRLESRCPDHRDFQRGPEVVARKHAQLASPMRPAERMHTGEQRRLLLRGIEHFRGYAASQVPRWSAELWIVSAG